MYTLAIINNNIIIIHIQSVLYFLFVPYGVLNIHTDREWYNKGLLFISLKLPRCRITQHEHNNNNYYYYRTSIIFHCTPASHDLTHFDHSVRTSNDRKIFDILLSNILYYGKLDGLNYKLIRKG